MVILLRGGVLMFRRDLVCTPPSGTEAFVCTPVLDMDPMQRDRNLIYFHGHEGKGAPVARGGVREAGDQPLQ